jgi:hypothetical protein
MAIDEVNERSLKVINLAFTDEDGTAVTPISASYRIDDVGSDAEIRDDTAIAIADPDTDVDIPLVASDTSILDETHPYETRRLTYSWTYNTLTSPSVVASDNAEYLYNVLNLKGVTTPSPA